MTPEHRVAKKRLLEALHTWKNLVPPGWDIHHLFIESKVDTESPEVLAETECHWQYHQATIRWSLPNVAGVEDKYLDATVVHELVHVMVAPMESLLRTDEGEHSGAVNGMCEFAVESVARAILRVAL